MFYSKLWFLQENIQSSEYNLVMYRQTTEIDRRWNEPQAESRILVFGDDSLHLLSLL